MSNLFAGIHGHEQVTSYLSHAFEADQITHAYLLAGEDTALALDIARRFAAALLANDDPAAYEEALRGVHPDLHVYTPGGAGAYLVEQIRELTRDAELAPIRSERKIYIVSDAHALSGPPANALLKTLEEPPSNVTCVLIAKSEASVLETLKSRCEVLTLNASTREQKANAQIIDILCALSRSCGNQELFRMSKQYIDIAHEMAETYAEDTVDTESYIEKYDEFLSQGAKKQIEQQGKREITARERAALLDQLDQTRLFFRDCIAYAEGAPFLLSYPDDFIFVMKFGGSTRIEDLLRAVRAVETTMARISYNVTPQLAIEAMFLEIREALCR